MKKDNKLMRVRRSESEIKSLLKEQSGSNMNVNEFCSTHQISRALFYNWRNKYSHLKKEAGFVPVQLSDDVQAQSIFAEIEFSQRLSIRLFRHVDPAYLRALLKP
jgi:transposase-like protein